MTQERRRHPRYEAPGLTGTFDERHAFETLKISVGGMLVRLPWEPALDHLAAIELGLEDAVFRSPARVVFVGPDMGDGQGGRWRIGLAFQSPRPDQQLLLERFIRERFELD